MSAQGLGSRAIIGEFFLRLEQALGESWVGPLSMKFTSDQASETYKWLGMIAGLREWVGSRHAKGFTENGITIANKKFEDTLEVLVDEIRRDKTTQVMLRVAELADRANAHDAELLTTLIENGETDLCYDGQAFFDTDHTEGNNTTNQSNDITYDSSSTTVITAAEAEAAVLQSVQRILGVKDNENKSMNSRARAFRIMVPTPFFAPFAAALKNPIIIDSSGSRTNTLTNLGGFSFELDVNPDLSWTTKFATFRADAQLKPFIRQEELALEIAAQAEGSRIEFDEDKHHYGIKKIGNVGYGMWQFACLTTFT